MASRLDRLILLLDAGSTPAVRAAAAQQIGDIYKQHPAELGNLLSRVLVHLRSKKWETRTAAGQAVAAIAANVPQWDPAEPEGGADDDSVPVDGAAQALIAEQRGWLSFEKFDVLQVLRHGRQLLGSAGKEYDVDWGNVTAEQRLNLQKKNLKERLGMASQFMEEDILADDDFLKMPVSAGGANDSSKVSKETETITAGLSARERNRLKRKAKKDAKEQAKDKVRVVDLGARRESAASPTALKVEQDAPVTVTPQPCSDKMVVESSSLKNLPAEPGVEWPFEPVCEVLCLDVFDPAWEVRHGAGIGLREILKTHGAGAGKTLGVSAAENLASHRAWLEDCAVRLLCAFALDRFGDFVSDQVVAPVRETCAQALGALLRHMPGDIVLRVQEVLLCLIMQDDFGPEHSEIWEVRHAGLLGLKYAVAVRVDLVQTMLARTVDAVVLGLQDIDDDVRAVSASTLLPIAEQFVQYLPNRILKVLSVLWDCLVDLKDDLTASTASIMDLLAKLFSIPAVLKYMQEGGNSRPLVNVIPRIYPFFRHTIYSVRVAVLNTLLTLVTKSEAGPEQLAWVDDICLRLLFQNMIVETKEEIVTLSLQVWSAIVERARENPERVTSLSSPHVRDWFAVLTAPINVPIDSRLFFSTSSSFNTATRPQSSGSVRSISADGGGLAQDRFSLSSETVIRGRVAAATALGRLLGVWNHEGEDDGFERVLSEKLDSSLALSRQLAAVVLEEWAVFSLADDATTDFTKQNRLAASFHAKCCSILEAGGSLVIPEEKAALASVRGDCKALLDAFAAEDETNPVSVPALQSLEALLAGSSSFTVDAARAVAGATCDALLAAVKSKKSFAAVAPKIEDLRSGIMGGAERLAVMRRRAETGVLAAIAAAVVAMGSLPVKLNPLIRAVMSAVKAEENLDLQRRAGVTLSRMVAQFASGSSRSSPTEKVIRNLCTFLCADPSVTPLLEANQAREGILSLDASSREPPIAPAAAGAAKRPSLAGLTDADVGNMDIAAPREDETATAREARLLRRGAHIALCEVARKFGEHAVDRLPVLWSCMAEALESFLGVPEAPELAGGLGQNVVDALQVVSALVPVLHPALHDKVATLLPCIVNALKVPSVVVRNMASRALAVLCKVITVAAMNAVVRGVVPFLGDAANVTHRQGAVEAVYCIIGKMESAILPYVIFLVVPILGRMSDSDEAVRVVATNCFATLIKLVPLESGIPDPPGMPAEMLAHREKERSFLAQLMDSSKLEPFEIPVKINADLRKYQQEGVNWMAFLNKYQLHGILCDDMGLGKTLQSICILASDHYLRAEKHKQSKSPDSAPLPSLVVCPPTLTGHWEHEIKTFAPFLRPLCYSGGRNDRRALLKLIARHDVVIISYEILRNDIGELSKFNYNYCILDEGHIIKNAKTKLTKAIKSVWANHRLILSGTPVQNNVLELWSLFDFLMPGFLGTEKMFNEKFSRPILASRDAKSSSREQEAGAVALEALHKQVLPFLLRRLKEDVLSDLPPKIIQDYHCEMSSIQKRIYDAFAKSQAKSVISGDIMMGADEEMSSESKQGKAAHVFEGLQYLRKLCNHPLLVLNEKHPDYAKIMEQVKAENKTLHDLAYAPKLVALKELLQSCGIGVVAAGASGGDANGDLVGVDTVSQHRVLIFCQLKTMLDIIEQDLFKRHMPTVSYMRLDGSTDASRRHGIVQKFNADPSIDVLLLTTHVGGLGLNLTGADTVIFIEHDWNPMRDLQAMDRAHRIGQKKVVNVYRLITRGTLEEKIMGLQKFKLNIAATVVNQQNAGLQSMGTDQVLDLFSVTGETDEETGKRRPEDGKRATSKSVLENLQELWDESQYEEEYNLDGFIDSLKK